MRKLIITLGMAAALILAGAGAAQATNANNKPHATPACGSHCFNLSSLVLGTDVIQNAYIHGDTGTGGKVGQPLDLKLASNTRPNEDFSGSKVGTLSAFCGSMISSTSYVCLNYPGSYPVFESTWTPFGNQSGLCVGLQVRGLGVRADASQKVTLQRCGSSARTLWVGDIAHSTSHGGHFYTPWVNASDRNFSHPLVLTVDTGTVRPENRLKVERLNLLTGGVVPDTQEFTLTVGSVA